MQPQIPSLALPRARLQNNNEQILGITEREIISDTSRSHVLLLQGLQTRRINNNNNNQQIKQSPQEQQFPQQEQQPPQQEQQPPQQEQQPQQQHQQQQRLDIIYSQNSNYTQDDGSDEDIFRIITNFQVFFIFTGILAIIGLLILKFDINYRFIFIPILAVIFFEFYSALRKYQIQQSTRGKNTYLMDMLACVSYLTSLGLFILYQETKLISPIIFILPFAFYSLFNCTFGLGKGFYDCISLAWRIYIIAQTINIFLKVEDYVKWTWKVTFWLTWILLLVMLFYAAGLFFLTICTIFYSLNGEAFSYQYKGLIWMFIGIAGKGISGYLITQGFVELQENITTNTNTNETLIQGLSSWAFLSFLLNLSYLIQKQQFRLFVMTLLEKTVKDPENQSPRTQKKKIKLKGINDIPKFLYKQSSTYFQNAKETIQKTVKLDPKYLKNKKYQASKLPTKNLVIKEENNDQIIVSFPMKRVISHQNGIINKLKRVFEKQQQTSHQKTKNNTETNKNRVIPLTQQKVIKNIAEKGINQPESQNISLIKQEHDIIEEKHSEKSVNICLVCYDKSPDAVFMDCGHGGICYDCSLDLFKSTGECYLCRAHISRVLHIDLGKADGQFLPVISAVDILVKEGGEDSIEFQAGLSRSIELSREMAQED